LCHIHPRVPSNDTATTETHTLSLHDALPIYKGSFTFAEGEATNHFHTIVAEKPTDFDIVKTGDGSYILQVQADVKITHPEHSLRSEEHTSELQSRENLVCRLLLEKKKKKKRE